MRRIHLAGLGWVLLCAGAGCSSLFMPAPPPVNPDGSIEAQTPPGQPGGTGSFVIRVGGKPEGEISAFLWKGQLCYRAGRCRTDTKLPEGYPRPTPPGAMEIKRYPEVRRAEVSGSEGLGWSGSRGFWPLFRHISRRDIAMTAPVEMEFAGAAGDANEAREWRMAFLYERADLGPTGTDPSDARVEVRDMPPVTVLTIGVRGRRGLYPAEHELEKLLRWLDARPDWEPAGPVRVLGYNGPNFRADDRWWEVQLPIRPSTSKSPAPR